MMFYNGFNMLIDVVIGLSVWFFTYRSAWWTGYHAGVSDEIDLHELYENKGEANG
jgi:hypothetical protein